MIISLLNDGLSRRSLVGENASRTLDRGVGGGSEQQSMSSVVSLEISEYDKKGDEREIVTSCSSIGQWDSARRHPRRRIYRATPCL